MTEFQDYKYSDFSEEEAHKVYSHLVDYQRCIDFDSEVMFIAVNQVCELWDLHQRGRTPEWIKQNLKESA